MIHYLWSSEASRIRSLLGDEISSKRSAAPSRATSIRQSWPLPAVVSGCLLAVAPAVILRSPLPLLIIPLILVGVALQRRHLRFKLAERFERDYPALLLSLASAIRTGVDPLQALAQSAALFDSDSVMRSEVEAFRESIEAGMAEDEAVFRFGASIGHPDLRLFRTAFVLSRRQGGSLGGCLHRLTRVTRLRQSFRRKIRSAVAMQRLSSFGIAGCALALGVIQAATNPAALHAALQDPLGARATGAGLALIATGIIWMSFLTRARL